MHSCNNAYASRLIGWVRHAGVHFVTNPLDNSVLQGRFDAYPVRRGFTRVKELLAAGINVCIGHDELAVLLDMVTSRAAACFGLTDHRLEEGGAADLVVFDAATPAEVIRTIAPRLAVISVRGASEPITFRVRG